ncbi:hypothetical protein BgiBS90_004801, partial [Biomphalaria glabrata]
GTYPFSFPPNDNFSKCLKGALLPRFSFSMLLNFRPEEETNTKPVLVKPICLDKQWPAPN